MGTRKSTYAIAVITSMLLLTGAAIAQDGPTPDFEIVSYTIDGGGGTSTGGDFSLTGTIGQTDASVEIATGSVYTLAGGFWGGRLLDFIFKGGFEG